MKFLNSKSSKKSLIFMIVIMIISLLINITEITYINTSYNKIVNETILSLVTKVQNKYPDVDDKEIINSLNNEEKYSGSVLEKYGYDQDISYIKQIRSKQQSVIYINIGITSLISILFIASYLIYLYKENKKINNINNYLKEINNKNYTLKIDENGNDELSKLQNELYKTTVLLSESAKINEEKQIALSNSLADISHQLKTPLTSITIMLDNINDNPNMDLKTRNYFIKQIMKQIDSVNSLVISILKISKFDSGTIELKKDEIDVNQFISSIISKVSVLLDLKDIKVITKNVKGKFIGDFKWQQEAITNILKNAIEHSPNNSEICIEVQNTNLFLKIKIIDNGEGIDKEDIKHIFERFYKSKKSNKSSVGIGLNLAKTIIEKENGSIKVCSEVGKGSIFEIQYLKI